MEKNNFVKVVIEVPKEELDIAICCCGPYDVDISGISIDGYENLSVNVEDTKRLSGSMLYALADKLYKDLLDN